MNLATTIMLAIGNYTFYGVDGDNKLVYHGPDHSDLKRQTLEFIRTPNKRSGNNYGTRRGFIRFTQDIASMQADGSEKVEPMVTTMGLNFPVGIDTPSAYVTEQLTNIISVLQGGGVVLGDINWSAGLPATLAAFFLEGKF